MLLRIPAILLGSLLGMVLQRATPADAAIAFVQGLGTAQIKQGGTSLALEITADVPAGDTVIVSFAMGPKIGPVACTDARGNVWTLDHEFTRGSGLGGVRAITFSTRVTTALVTGDLITVTHENADERALSASHFSGLRASALDRKAAGNGRSTGPATAAIETTSAPDELLIGTIGVEGPGPNDAFAPGAGYTALARIGTQGGGAENNITVNAEYRIVSATGSYVADGVLNMGSSDLDKFRDWVALITTYRPTCGDGVLDPDEQCDDSNNASGDCCTPTCVLEPASATCRPAVGPCDVAEQCSGTSDDCPPDTLPGPGGVICRAAAGPCDVDEICDGVSPVCPPDTKSTAPCRPAAGICDVAESCDGMSSFCPPDGFTVGGTTCRAAAGVCDLTESCSGAGPACPGDAKSVAVCRPAADACDAAESCDGASDACPADVLRPAGATCRAPGGACDLVETCTGASIACPPDALENAGVVCRPLGGSCDVAETCTGSAAACPADGFRAVGIECRASAGACDVPEACTGLAAVCPADGKSTATCRVSSRVCDLAESCTGSGNDCPTDAKSTATCRAAVGGCDLAEACTGLSDDCPPDAFLPDGATCRPTTGACDLSEQCSGTSPICPTDAFRAAGTSCRDAAGACDVVESCTGSGPACPADGFLPGGTMCRTAAGPCDRAEVCSGADAVCPADTGAPDGDGDGACDIQDVCLAIADPMQADGDGDGMGDACDPCTTGSSPGMTSRKLRVRGLKPPAGNETLAFTGSIVVPTTPEIDPAARGLRVLIAGSAGERVVDVTIPGGPGWKANRERTKWAHRGARGERIRGVVLQRSRSTPGKIRFAVTGRGSFTPPVAGPIVASLILDAPYAATGQCGEAVFSACRRPRSGKTLICN